MAKQNMAFLYGRVSKAPIINMNKETGEYLYGMVYVDTVRSLRHVDDDVRFVKHDHPLVMSREKEFIDMMREWKENDVVYIKGVVTSKSLNKASFCPGCKDENGNPVKNEVKGNLIYITPIYARKVAEYQDKNAAIEDVVKNREISNQVYAMGTLIRDPKMFTTKKHLRITQYIIAMNRKFKIRTDDQSITTDWPVVKSYGEMALDDKLRLRTGAEIYIDGFLQARTVTRKVKCRCCGKLYEFKDHAMEIVPYGIEYLTGYKSNDEIEAEKQMSIEQARQALFGHSDLFDDDKDEMLKSNDLVPPDGDDGGMTKVTGEL